MLRRQGLNLAKSVSQVNFRELVRSFLHVAYSKVIGLKELEGKSSQLDDTTNLEIMVLNVPLLSYFLMSLPLHELATPNA